MDRGLKYITRLFNAVIKGGRVYYIVFLIIFFFISVNNSYSQTTLTYTASGTFVPPAGVTSVSVVCRGGGGAGGGSTLNKYAGNGGGGGGCSVNTSLTVTAGTSYNITVGIGGTGSTGNGGNGGSSSFGSLLTAGGGTGGNANSASGGGGGGTGTYSGGNGFDSDNNKNGPGGGGGGGGGTIANGGTATSRLGGAGGTSGGGVGGDGGWGGNIGNIGSIPGGGGGGGGDLSGSGSTNGGDGARGEITITYTCSSYSLYSLWVNGSICQGSTATVNMSAVIPVGTYTVTYNLSGANSATGNTSQMIVTSSGSGSFVTSSLANSGSTTVTITRLSSGSGNGVDPLCYSDISSNNTVNVTVNSTPYITLGAFPVVCLTTTTAYLSYTATNAEYYSIDFDATANSAGFTDFSGWGLPASPISINVPYSAPAATYNGTLTVGTYTPSCTGNSYPITVTVSGSPPVAPTSAASDRDNFCSDDAGNISLSVTGGSGTTLRWFTGSCGGTEVGTGNPLVIASPASTTTYYARWENGCGNSTCASVTVTVASLVTASVSISASSNPVCSGTSVTFTATPTNGGVTPAYQWKKNGSNVGSDNYQYTDASLVNNDQISCEMTSSLSCATPIPATSNTITMTVNPLPQGSISGNTICSGGTGLLTYSSSSGTGPFELIINGVTYSNVSSGVAFNASPNPAVTTNYTLTSITDANGCVRTGSFDDATATISVNSVVGGTISADRAFCSVVNTPPISVSGSSGSGTLSYRWESSTTDCSSGFSAISGGTLEDYDPPVLAQTTYYRRATISTLNGVACEAYSTCMTVTVYPIPTVTVTNITQAADSIYGSGGADICPELNPPDFKPENGSYDPGATYIDFRIDRVNTNGTWLFGYTTSGGTILDVKVTGDDTANPPVLDLPLEEVDCKDNDKVYMRFKIDNVVNTTINFDFLFFIVIDQQNCTNAYGNHYFQIIDPMPAVGPFN